jgi:hypothetical protein
MKKMSASLHVGIHRIKAGEVWQTNNVLAELRELMNKLRVKALPRFLEFPTPR